jgi:hypothetical protein
MRRSNAFMRRSDAFMRRSDAFMRRSDAFMPRSQAFIRRGDLFIRQGDGVMRAGRRSQSWTQRTYAGVVMSCVIETPVWKDTAYAEPGDDGAMDDDQYG